LSHMFSLIFVPNTSSSLFALLTPATPIRILYCAQASH
jgi:hypothetical protein